jgi:hypothetical protein
VSILYQNGSVETFEAEKLAPESPTATSLIQTNRPRDMKSADINLYLKYRSGRKMAGWGTPLAIVGVTGSATGAFLGEYDETLSVSMVIIGSAFTATGIWLVVAGKRKKNDALREYHKNYTETPVKDAPRFQLNMHGNGVGLAYVF